MGIRSTVKNFVTTRLVDPHIEKALSRLAAAYHKSLERWYRSNLVNLVLVLVLAGWGLHASPGAGSLLAVSGIVWIMTIVFLVRRVINVRYVVKNRRTIAFFGPVMVRAWWSAPMGFKLKASAAAVYDHFFEKKTNRTTRGLLRTAARWQIVPGQDEVFDRFWGAFRDFVRTIVLSKLVQGALLTVFIGALGWFVRDGVQLNLHEASWLSLYTRPFTALADSLSSP